MIFIFGFGHITERETGEKRERYCPVCRENVLTKIVETRKWFTFFFIPLIPYNKTVWEVCPKCGNFNQINK